MNLDDIFPATSVMTETELLRFANDEIARFDAFFGTLGNAPLTRPEAAILRTYLVALATGRFPSALAVTETSMAPGE
jgi:hypothetical protein